MRSNYHLILIPWIFSVICAAAHALQDEPRSIRSLEDKFRLMIDAPRSAKSAINVNPLKNETWKQFWEANYELNPRFVDSNARDKSSRLQWMKMYRAFIPGDNLEKHLALNISAYNDYGPLENLKDIYLSQWRNPSDQKRSSPPKNKQGKTNKSVGSSSRTSRWELVHIADLALLKSKESNHPMQSNLVTSDGLSSVFREGSFELIVTRAEYRSSTLADLCLSLAKLFGVPVDAKIVFTPEDFESPIQFRASDTYIIGFDGETLATLYEPGMVYPLEHQEYLPIQQDMDHEDNETLTSNSSVQIRLQEGDVLYIPRGWQYHFATPKGFSLRVEIAVHLEVYTFRDAILDVLKDLVLPFGEDWERFFNTGDGDDDEDDETSASSDDDDRRRKRSPKHISGLNKDPGKFPDLRPQAASRNVLLQAIRKSERTTWAELLEPTIKVVSDLAPDFRMHYPRSPWLVDVLRAYRNSMADLPYALQQQISHFVEAGSGQDSAALLIPMISVLGDEKERQSMYAKSRIIRLARELSTYLIEDEYEEVDMAKYQSNMPQSDEVIAEGDTELDADLLARRRPVYARIQKHHLPANLLTGFSMALAQFRIGADATATNKRIIEEHQVHFQTREIRTMEGKIGRILKRYHQPSPKSFGEDDANRDEL